MKPKMYLIYFKDILDRCMARFFAEHDSEFAKDQDGRYVFSSAVSESELSRIFTEYVKDELGRMVHEYRESRPEFYFVIGSCYPGDNVFLEIGGRAPKLRRLVELLPDLKYFLKESDIQMDMRMFNSVFDDVFLGFMNERKRTWRNVHFVRHAKADCYLMYRFLKRRFGSMSVNLAKKLGMGKNKVIFSINDEIDRICPFKDVYIERGIFKSFESEVNQYLDECMSGDF